MTNAATYTFTHSNKEMAERQYHFLRDHGVEGGLEQQGEEWVLTYAEIGRDFYCAVIAFYEELAAECEKSNHGKELVIDVNQYECVSYDLENEANLVGGMWRQQADFFRGRLEANATG